MRYSIAHAAWTEPFDPLPTQPPADQWAKPRLDRSHHSRSLWQQPHHPYLLVRLTATLTSCDCAMLMHACRAYIKMMGTEGIRNASAVAVLHANYMAERLAPHFPVTYRCVGWRTACHWSKGVACHVLTNADNGH